MDKEITAIVSSTRFRLIDCIDGKMFILNEGNENLDKPGYPTRIMARIGKKKIEEKRLQRSISSGVTRMNIERIEYWDDM